MVFILGRGNDITRNKRQTWRGTTNLKKRGVQKTQSRICCPSPPPSLLPLVFSPHFLPRASTFWAKQQESPPSSSQHQWLLSPPLLLSSHYSPTSIHTEVHGLQSKGHCWSRAFSKLLQRKRVQIKHKFGNLYQSYFLLNSRGLL